MSKKSESSDALTLPLPEKKSALNCEVEADLLSRVKSEAKKRKLTIRQAVEFGLKKFLEETQK